jgi:protein-tyrosine-phosphatase
VNSTFDHTSLLKAESDDRVGVITLLIRASRVMAEHAKQALRCRVARVALERIRRNPATLVRALGTAHQVLIVCHGNIIRSAFAGRLLQQQLGETADIRIASAGVQAMPGRPSHPLAVLEARRVGVDLTQHAASRITADDVRASDVVLTVDLIQYVALRDRFPDVRDKLFLLTALEPAIPLEIDDPVMGDRTAFERCFAHINLAIDPIRRVIEQSRTRR